MTLQKKATVISSASALFLTLVKLVIGIMSGSVAVLASAIDSIMDMFVSIFNFFAISKSEQPADDKFNYGKGKIEALAAVIEGSVIATSGLFILYQSIKKAYIGETTNYLGVSIIVMLISVATTFLLVRFLENVAKKTDSMVIKSDALHYKTDLYTNGGILLSLLLVSVSGIEIIDSITGAIIAIYVLYSSYELLKEGVLNLLDIALEDEIVEQIKKHILSSKEINDYHYLKTRKSGNTNFVDVHIVFKDSQISLLKAHTISDEIEYKIRSLDSENEWAITIHLDPYDDSK